MLTPKIGKITRKQQEKRATAGERKSGRRHKQKTAYGDQDHATPFRNAQPSEQKLQKADQDGQMQTAERKHMIGARALKISYGSIAKQISVAE